MPSRFIVVMASVAVAATLAIATPAAAQGKSGSAPGKNRPTPPPTSSTGALSAATNIAASTATTTTATAAAPFAWMDDANVMAPGTVWFGVSMVRWQGGGASEVVVPVVDGSIGLTPRIQIGASVPRVAGGIGTTFFTAKIGVLTDDARGLKVAVGPTLEVLSSAAMQWGPVGQSRAQWGLPVSVQVDRGAGRLYGSSGYFSPGIWYAGVGFGRSVSDRAGVSMSFSRAWTSSASAILTTPAGPRRNDLSGGGSFDVTPNIAVFGSVGRTLGTSIENGAGTTLSFGMSLSAGPVVFTR